MREMSVRSGVSEGTLRMWESRHDFPVPHRLPSGHRRYSELDLARVRAVVEAREQGLSLTAAIERARQLTDGPRPSVFAAVRAGFPQLQPRLLPKRALVWMSHAIEDESVVWAGRGIVIGCFQHELFYRQSERRWRELARTAERAIVLADFERPRRLSRAPAEVPIGDEDPLMREWVLVCEAQPFAACLVALERPAGDGARRFETIWTVEGRVVREVTRVCCELVARSAPELVEGLRAGLTQPPAPPSTQLRNVLALTSRMVAYAAGG